MAGVTTVNGVRQGAKSVPDATASLQSRSGNERRREPRFPYQTVVTLVRVQNGETFELRKCWTRDLSPSGARIMSLEPIEGALMLLKFLLPKLGSKFIEAEVCSRFEEQHTDMRNRSTTMYLYGVRFTSVLSDEDACDRLL